MNQSPLDDSSQPVDLDQSIQPYATPHALDGGWETINFPGALDVDAIPMEAAVTQARPEVTRWDPGIGPDGDALCQLQQENIALRSQVVQLEADLAQLQIELQLEVARYYCKEVEAIEPPQAVDRTTTVDLAQAQIQQLTHALEISEATNQQQQQEIESLTDQLNTSHQRIAQLERDCALSQQRYNEQLQLVSQAENTCQDLRMRLHRQQQQTLQFKAALEKSIEMNAALETMQSESIALTEPETGHASEDASVAFIPKAKPVQPWSEASGSAPQLNISAKHPGSGLPELLSKLAKPSGFKPTAAVESEPVLLEPVDVPPQSLPVPENSMDESGKHILEFLFPAHATPLVADVPPPQAAVFDLSPFIEAGEVDVESLSNNQNDDPIATVIHHPPTAAPTPLEEEKVIQLERPRDQLWADLAQLIEPEIESVDAIPASEMVEPTTTSTSNETVEHRGFYFEQAQSIDVAAFPPLESAVAREDKPVTAHNPFPSFTLHASEQPQANRVTTATAATEVSSTATVTSFPSPILYPTRQPKKLASMAAVDLPSFPRG
jgi:hypothetical protein